MDTFEALEEIGQPGSVVDDDAVRVPAERDAEQQSPVAES